jgi:hypothetical protein
MLGTGLVGLLLSVPARPLLLRTSPEALPLLVPNRAPLLVLPREPTISPSGPTLEDAAPDCE